MASTELVVAGSAIRSGFSQKNLKTYLNVALDPQHPRVQSCFQP